jgi:amino acid adenylation domain-containing protein
MMEETTDTFQGSPQQDEQWRREPSGPSGRIQAVVVLDGPLDPEALSAALNEVVARHEILRTTFGHQEGILIPLQVVGDSLAPDWTISDGTDDVAEALAAERERPVDLQGGPVVRCLLLQLAPERHTLILTLPTLHADVSSMSLLAGELAHHYGAAVEIAEDPLQYADFAAWQAELSESVQAEALAAREVWGTFEAMTAPALPFARRSTSPFQPQEVSVVLAGSPTPAHVQAAWHALLGRVTGEHEVVVSCLSPARRHGDLEGAIGAFARPVPVLTPVDGELPFAALLESIESARARAAELQDYAPPEAPEALTIGFLDGEGFRDRASEVSIALERTTSTGHPWRLWLEYTAAGSAGSASIRFDPACYERDAVERLARELGQLVGAAAADPSAAIGSLPILDDQEREQVLVAFNDTADPAAIEPVHERVVAHAAASATDVAVIDERGTITYAELDARANQLAHRLRASGVGPDVAVGLCTERSVAMVTGLLGILKAGGAYVPLNHEHPAARLGQQLTTAGARVIVSQEALLGRLPEWDGEVVCLDRDSDRARLDAEPSSAPGVRLTAENLAYVIYTSGSTGTPKGVEVTHGNLANYVADMTRRLGADGERLTFGLITSISTDLGNTSVFGALGSGGTLLLVSPAAAADGALLARQFEANPVDVLKITPSHIGALLVGDDARILPRRVLVTGGEAAPWDLVARVRALSGCAILNHYGPTETTIGSCTFAVGDGPGPFAPATVPIGRPIRNTACYVLDERLTPAPIGSPGTLHIGGAGVARGYVGQPELTDTAFVADPFSPDTGARMYNTGDRVRWLPDGALEFLGRVDEQVKIRGYRVEPTEVESALRLHPQVGEAVVVARPGSAGDLGLVAYCAVLGPVGADELRGHLAARLPEFMIPWAIVSVDELPRTPSGKIDRLALPDPSLATESAAGPYVAPRTPVEQAVADLWSQTLGVERIGIDDDFFELGGHSLLATQVVAQIRSGFAVDLPLHSLFTCPTVELLAGEIVGLMGASEQDETERLMAELEGLSDEEAERLLAGEATPPDAAQG